MRQNTFFRRVVFVFFYFTVLFSGEQRQGHVAFANCVSDGGRCEVSDISTQAPSNLNFSPTAQGINNAALVATGGGIIQGQNLTITTPFSDGFYAGFAGTNSHLDLTGTLINGWHGLHAVGANSALSLNNTSITTEKSAIFLQGNFGGTASATLTNVDLTSTGMDEVVVQINSNGNNKFSMDGGSITGMNLGGVSAGGDNQTVKLSNVTVNSGGSYGVDISSSGASGNQLDIIGGSIIHQGTNTSGAVNFAGGDVLIDGAVIKNIGTGSAVGLNFSSSISRLTAKNNFDFESFGNGAAGLNINNTGQAFLQDGKITTHGDFGYGIIAFDSSHPLPLHAERVKIETHGTNAHGIQLGGGSSTLVDVDIKVNNPAAGLLAFGNQVKLEMTGGSVDSAGAGVTVASVVNNMLLPVNHLKFVGTKITASGINASAVQADRGSHIEFDNTEISSLNNTTGGYGILARSGSTVDIRDNTTVVTDGVFAPALTFVGATATNTIMVDHSTVKAQDSFAVLANGGTDVLNINNSTVEGDRLIFAGNCQPANCGSLFGSNFNFNTTSSQIFGHAAVSNESTLTLNLGTNSLWTLYPSNTTGATTSDISFLTLDNSHIVFDHLGSSAHQSLQVGRGELGGNSAVYNAANGSSITFNTLLNDGGTLTNQFTDRLLIDGDVSGTTLVNIAAMPGSPGGLTGSSAGDGISIIQVSGTAAADSFKLPAPITLNGTSFLYDLYSFAPGQTDAGQRLVSGTGDNFWDFRLQNAMNGMVAPQVSSYITAPTALFQAGLSDISTLHQRLDEIRHKAAKKSDTGRGHFFFRSYAGDYNHTSNLAISQYGYNSHIRHAAIQLGGNLYSLKNDKRLWMFGLSNNLGHLSFSPRHVVGSSKTNMDVRRITGYATYLRNSGFYIDTLLSYGNFKGTISTQTYGKGAKLTGNSFATSIETGWPFPLNSGGGRWSIEPQAQLVYQRQLFDRAIDSSTTLIPPGFVVALGDPDQWIGRIGARLKKSMIIQQDHPATLYGKINFIHGFGDGNKIYAGNDFYTSGFGTNLELGLGMGIETSQNTTFYADASWQERIQSAGSSGFAINVGFKLRF